MTAPIYVTVRLSERSRAVVAGNVYESVEHLACRAARFWFDHVDHVQTVFSLADGRTMRTLDATQSLRDAGVTDGSEWTLTVRARDA